MNWTSSATRHLLFAAAAAQILLVLPGIATAEDLFDTNRVLEIRIQMAPADWNVLRYQHRESEFFPESDKKPTTNAYSWFPATVTIDGHVALAKVRKKGYIGSNDTKHPALKLQIGDASNGTELTLNNNNQDPSLVRQYLVYEVFRRAGVPAPRCNFARVIVNGKELGVYSHVEGIKKPFLKRHFGRDDGPLYEGGRSDFRPGWFENFEVKSGSKSPSSADLAAVTKAVESPDERLVPELSRLIDLEEFLRFWAVESLVNDGDGYASNVNNYFLYHNPVNDKFSFIPWGKDTVMYSGRRGEGSEAEPKSVIAVGILAYRLYTAPEGSNRYRAALRQVLKTAWDEEALLRELDRVQALLAPALKSNAEQVTAAINDVRVFIKKRRAELEPELAGPAPKIHSKPLPFARRRNIGHWEGTFKARWGKLSQAEPIGQGSGQLSGTLYGQKIALAKVGAQAGLLGTPGAETSQGITLGGLDSAGGRGFLIYLSVDSELYAPEASLPVDNTHVFGGLLEMTGQGQISKMVGMLHGSLKLHAAGHETDGPVEGEVSVDVFSKLPGP